MTVDLNTFELTWNKPLDGGAFVAGLDAVYAKAAGSLRETFRIYEAVGSRIIRERNAIVTDSASWDYVYWAGIYIKIKLRSDEGFDALYDYYEHLAHQTKHVRADVPTIDRKTEPDPEDYPELRRRCWTFRVGAARCTLGGFADESSETCKLVEVGTEPKFELHCAGSPLPVRAA